MRSISILGVTGSVGDSTIDLLRDAQARGQPWRLHAVTGAQNIAKLAAVAQEFQARLAVTADPARLGDLRAALAGSGIRAEAGPEALAEAASLPADLVVNAIIGFAGLAPSLAALQAGARLALANKESLVTAGPLLMQTAARHGTTILPLDSEHSAIFQALAGEDIARVERIIITASGGAFRDWPLERLREASVEQASTHPNWAMGQRITIDSASMFNKALEVIETREYFGIDPDRIEVLVHPESIIHALVGHRDGALMAHLGAPDMRHPIGFALNWPERAPLPVARLDLAAIGRLSFSAPDPARYPALAMAREVMAIRGLAGAVFNGAKEAALDAFLARRIRFTDMASLVEAVLARMSARGDLGKAALSLDNLQAADAEARALTAEAARALAAA